MSIAPFSFRDLSDATEPAKPVAGGARPFLPSTHSGRKQKEEAPPPPPPPPTFSEEQLKAAERDGYQKGFLAGIVEGKNQAASQQAEIDKALADLVASFAAYIDPLFSVYRDMLRIQAEQMPKIAYGIARKVAGDALEKNAGVLVEEICRRCIATMSHEPKLTVTLHASLADTLEQKLKTVGGPAIQVIGDPNITPANCRIEWKNGAMVRDNESLWQQVEQVVAGMVASGARDAGMLCDNMASPPEEAAPPEQQPDPANGAEPKGE